MTKAESISKDILDEAERLLVMSDWPRMTRSDMDNAQPVVAKAIATEREKMRALEEAIVWFNARSALLQKATDTAAANNPDFYELAASLRLTGSSLLASAMRLPR